MATSEFYVKQQAIIEKLESLKDNQELSLDNAYHLLCIVSQMVDIIAAEWNTAAECLAAKAYNITFDDDKCFRVLPPDTGVQLSGWRIESKPPQPLNRIWIENFKAVHPRWGTVEGNFNSAVTAYGGKTAYDEFVKAHPCMEFQRVGPNNNTALARVDSAPAF